MPKKPQEKKTPTRAAALPEAVAKPLKVLSLFSGCGGMDLGFEGGFSVMADSINESVNPDYIAETTDSGKVNLKETKFEAVFANDIMPDARHAWVNYFSKKGYTPDIYHVDSIVDLVKAHKSGTKVFPDKVDVVTGGFPCQDFSLAGKRNGFNSHKDHHGQIIDDKDQATVETRGQLYMWMKEVIEITRPNIFIAENVKGLVNLENVKEIIQHDFSKTGDNGYIVLNPMVLHAADYGVSQSRERVIFIGIKKSELNKKALSALSSPAIPEEYNPYPSPTHTRVSKEGDLKAHVKLRTVLGHLPEPDKSTDPSQIFYSKAKFMGKHCQGQTEIKWNGIAPTIRAEHHGNIEFRRLSLANEGKMKSELDLGYKERRLTPRECALIQTFPEEYDFVVPLNGRSFVISPSMAYKLIGNAVPPLLAYHIARRIEKVWDLYFDKKADHVNYKKSRPTSGSVRASVK